MTNSLTLQQESEMIDDILHKSFPIPTVYQYRRLLTVSIG